MTLPSNRAAFGAAILAMAGLVALSNVLVQHPVEWGGLNQWMTWGAISYPICFLVNDLANRRLGLRGAQRVVVVGFAVGVALSLWLSTPRIALASGAAFLVAHLLDAYVFDRMRGLLEGEGWWKTPLVSSTAGSAIDTALFFSLAFYGTGVPWTTLAVGDFAVKMLIAVAVLVPFRFVTKVSSPWVKIIT